MLCAQSLSYGYRADVPVVRSLNLSLAPGELVCLVGPNGCGKSTTLKLLAGLLVPGSGTASLSGSDIISMRARYRAQRLAYVPQRTDLAFSYTIRDYVGMGLVSLGLSAKQRITRINDALNAVGLTNPDGMSVHELSVGNRQRATLARALSQLGWVTDESSHRGAVLLADEPTSAMDPHAAEHAMALLRGITREPNEIRSSVLLVSHDVSLAVRWADRMIVQDQAGAIAADDSPVSVVDSGVLTEVFGVELAGLTQNGRLAAVAPTLPTFRQPRG